MSYTVENCIQDVKVIESLLEEKFNAHGRGLHEKISSSGNNLSAMEIRCLRVVATSRNKLLHESNFNLDSIPDDFQQLCSELVDSINRKGKWSTSGSSLHVKHGVRSSGNANNLQSASKARITFKDNNVSTKITNKTSQGSEGVKKEIASVWVKKIIKPLSQILAIPISEALRHIKVFMDDDYPKYYERYVSFVDNHYGKAGLYEEFGMLNRKRESMTANSSVLIPILTLLISDVAHKTGRDNKTQKIISHLKEKELFPK